MVVEDAAAMRDVNSTTGAGCIVPSLFNVRLINTLTPLVSAVVPCLPIATCSTAPRLARKSSVALAVEPRARLAAATTDTLSVQVGAIVAMNLCPSYFKRERYALYVAY